VRLKIGATIIRTVTADSGGNFTFWAPANAYTLEATNGAKTGQTAFTLSNTNVIKTVNVTIQ
jgi:hypothetical protein